MATTNEPTPQLLPIIESNRLQQLDIIRGIAILGILILNIPIFGLPETISGTIYGIHNQGLLNRITWYITSTFFDGNMRGLFCFLFGAGIILFSEQGEKNGRGSFTLYRRMLWLIVFAAVDIFVLLWYGDILYEYAICGLLLIPIRKLKPKYLLSIGISIMIFLIVFNLNDYKETQEKFQKYTAIESRINSKEKLTKNQKTIKKNWETISSNFPPLTKEKLSEYKTNTEKEIKENQVNYKKSVVKHFEEIKYIVDPEMYFMFLPELIPMLFGMALFKLGWFTLNNRKRNKKLAIIGLSLGFGMSIYNTYTQPTNLHCLNWFMKNVSCLREIFYPLINPTVCLGLIGTLLLFCSSKSYSKLKNILASTGKMAFTNYLMQSLICTLIFNAYGLGLYGELERYQLYFVVVTVWIINISFSVWWLKRYSLGPMEWIWRMLTYWKRIPIRR